jgi:CHAT domain-containing protein
LSQYGSAELYFRKGVAPVYFDLVDALLQASDKVADERDAKRLWEQARDTMELMKGAELRNYFKDECLTELKAKAVTLESLVDQRRDVAVVYPILLPKRLELLVKTHSGLKRYSLSDCGQEKLRAAAQRFYKTLKSDKFIEPCQDLYDWLVRPYVQDLDDTITTLVFVPDGILRTIAVAALHDGRHFLVEKFQLAIAPALTMVEPKPLDKTAPNALLAGVSEAITFPQGSVEPDEHYRALKKVPAELREVQNLFGGQTLLNADFSRKRFATALNETTPSIIHIASHAHFSDNYRESFILAYNQKILIDELENLIGLARFRDDPIELLMLSACETAAGDERAALGLAGVAVKAGARSAIGSLWSIADEPAYELVAKFYYNLKHRPGCSKAEALRLAQIDLLKSNMYAHPRHWSGFILVNNWL